MMENPSFASQLLAFFYLLRDPDHFEAPDKDHFETQTDKDHFETQTPRIRIILKHIQDTAV